MNRRVVLGCLRSQWREHLLRHGHLLPETSDARVLRSCDSRGQYHQWLLLVGDAPVRCLSRSEHGFIRSHLRGTGEREKIYLVVGFPGEPGRIVALPARAALKAGRIYSHRAGIAWDS